MHFDLGQYKRRMPKINSVADRPVGSGAAWRWSPHQKFAGREREKKEKERKKERKEEKEKRGEKEGKIC